jgi:hypothetical protein
VKPGWFGGCQGWKSTPLVTIAPATSAAKVAPTITAGELRCETRYMKRCEQQTKHGDRTKKDRCPADAEIACKLTQANQAKHPGSWCGDLDERKKCATWIAPGVQ